jgi:hypothetical protein
MNILLIILVKMSKKFMPKYRNILLKNQLITINRLQDISKPQKNMRENKII